MSVNEEKPVKRGPGRPPGAPNKKKKRQKPGPKPVKRGKGRPPGSKNKKKKVTAKQEEKVAKIAEKEKITDKAIKKYKKETATAKDLDIMHKAELFYITNPAGLSLESMCRLEEFSDVLPTTMQNWCTKREWQKKRADYLESVTQRLKKRLGTELVQHQLDSLKRINAMLAGIYQTIDSGTVLPKSQEGMVGAWVQLAKYRDDVMGYIAKDMVGTVDKPLEGGVPENIPELDVETLQVAAKAILAKNRENTRQLLAENSVDDIEVIEDKVSNG